MTPREALAAHLAKRPEMPRPYVPESPAAKAHQKALQAWVDEREVLVSAVNMDGIHITFERQTPQVTPRADYIYLDLSDRPRKRPTRPAWSGSTAEYNATKKRESRARQRERASQAAREVIKGRDAV